MDMDIEKTEKDTGEGFGKHLTPYLNLSTMSKIYS